MAAEDGVTGPGERGVGTEVELEIDRRPVRHGAFKHQDEEAHGAEHQQPSARQHETRSAARADIDLVGQQEARGAEHQDEAAGRRRGHMGCRRQSER